MSRMCNFPASHHHKALHSSQFSQLLSPSLSPPLLEIDETKLPLFLNTRRFRKQLQTEAAPGIPHLSPSPSPLEIFFAFVASKASVVDPGFWKCLEVCICRAVPSAVFTLVPSTSKFSRTKTSTSKYNLTPNWVTPCPM